MKICLVGAEFFCSDGQTDMIKLIVTFCSCVYMPKNGPLMPDRSDFMVTNEPTKCVCNFEVIFNRCNECLYY